ncbi:MAG: hypothetical protein V4691_09495 [Pseudomonadota bacterium]
MSILSSRWAFVCAGDYDNRPGVDYLFAQAVKDDNVAWKLKILLVSDAFRKTNTMIMDAEEKMRDDKSPAQKKSMAAFLNTGKFLKTEMQSSESPKQLRANCYLNALDYVKAGMKTRHTVEFNFNPDQLREEPIVKIGVSDWPVLI